MISSSSVHGGIYLHGQSFPTSLLQTKLCPLVVRCVANHPFMICSQFRFLGRFWILLSLDLYPNRGHRCMQQSSSRQYVLCSSNKRYSWKRSTLGNQCFFLSPKSSSFINMPPPPPSLLSFHLARHNRPTSEGIIMLCFHFQPPRKTLWSKQV